jgi:hypothetical protein
MHTDNISDFDVYWTSWPKDDQELKGRSWSLLRKLNKKDQLPLVTLVKQSPFSVKRSNNICQKLGMKSYSVCSCSMPNTSCGRRVTILSNDVEWPWNAYQCKKTSSRVTDNGTSFDDLNNFLLCAYSGCVAAQGQHRGVVSGKLSLGSYPTC